MRRYPKFLQVGPETGVLAMYRDVLMSLSGVWRTGCRLGVLTLSLFAFGANALASELVGVRFGEKPAETRVVLDLIGPPSYIVSGDSSGNGRVFVDFEKLSGVEPASTQINGKGHVGSVFLARRDGDSYRAAINLKKTASIKQVFLIEPEGKVKKYRLVIDLKTGDREAFLKSLPSAYPDLSDVIQQATANNAPDKSEVVVPPPSRKEVRAPTRQNSKKYTIVIDAGHGGRDPGAIGQQGTQEKTVTLAAAKKLKETLEARGRYNVVLTRASDVAVDIEKREPIARKAGADLFISLHADALASKAVRGGSIYTLSEQGTKRSARLAKSDGNYRVYNLEVDEFGEEVGEILFDLAQVRTNNASSQLASALLEELTGVTPLLNRSHRQADLRVLLAPDVPAVLFEMGYISNRKDEANLINKEWRRKTMAAVADAIDAFFKDRESRQLAANGTGGGR